MYRSIKIAIAHKAEAHAVVLLDSQKTLPAGYAGLDKQLGGAIAAAVARPEFCAKLGAVTTIYPAQGAARVFIVGLGDGARITDAARVASSKLVGAAYAARVNSLGLHVLPAVKDVAGFDAEAVGAAIGEGLTLGNFEFDAFKGTASAKAKKSGKPAVTELTVELEASLHKAADKGRLVSESANMARTLSATPPNVANPKYLCDFAKKMAKEAGLACEIIDNDKAKKLGMGGLTAVGAGGSEKPAMICLEWKGKGAANKEGPILLVGKAITFDTGGYSLKPMPGMLGMKYDKSGGMTVLAAMQAVAKLKLPVHVVGLVPTAENMIDEDAYRPNDIITFYNGVTCEITNTDAEGRLILADALAYGCATYKPRAVIDLATLTGAVVIALGIHCAGAFINDHGLHKRLFDAAEITGERLWHLPLWEEHKDYMKGSHSDLVNSGIREAGAIQGAAFLSYFVAKDGDFTKNEMLPWAHLDIAGTAELERETPLFPKGPTGFGVRLLVRAIEQWK
jgi:leucyl aminopeptidase